MTTFILDFLQWSDIYERGVLEKQIGSEFRGTIGIKSNPVCVDGDNCSPCSSAIL